MIPGSGLSGLGMRCKRQAFFESALRSFAANPGKLPFAAYGSAGFPRLCIPAVFPTAVRLLLFCFFFRFLFLLFAGLRPLQVFLILFGIFRFPLFA